MSRNKNVKSIWTHIAFQTAKEPDYSILKKKKNENLSSQQGHGLDSAFIISDGLFVSERGVRCNLVVLAGVDGFNHSLNLIPKLS